MSVEILESAGVRALVLLSRELGQRALSSRREAREKKVDAIYAALLRGLSIGFMASARMMLSEARARCEHEEWEELYHECVADDRPISMNPFTDVIRYQTWRWHSGEERCTLCGFRREFDDHECYCYHGRDEREPDDE